MSEESDKALKLLAVTVQGAKRGRDAIATIREELTSLEHELTEEVEKSNRLSERLLGKEEGLTALRGEVVSLERQLAESAAGRITLRKERDTLQAENAQLRESLKRLGVPTHPGGSDE